MFSDGYKVIYDNTKDDKRISLGQLRKIDPNTSTLSDNELDKIRQSYYDWVQIMYENWYEEKFSSNNPIRLLTDEQ